MHYEGMIEAPVAREKFYEFMADPTKFIEALPDVVESKITDRDHFSVRARVGIGSLKGTFRISFETVAKEEGSMRKLAGHGQGMQSSVEFKLEIRLEDAPLGTKALWVADAAVGGLLASVGGRLIEGAAANYVRRITENIQAKVSA